REISHNVLVLYLGRAVEYGPTDILVRDPRHPYTRMLLASVLEPDPVLARARAMPRTTVEAPDPTDTRAALRYFRSRMIDDPDAVQYRPRWLTVGPGHYVAEHDPEERAAGR